MSHAYLIKEKAGVRHYWALCYKDFRAICLTVFDGFPPLVTLNTCVDTEQWLATPPNSQQGFIVLQGGKVILAQTDDSQIPQELEPHLLLLRSLRRSTSLPQHDVLPLLTMLRPAADSSVN